MPLDIIEKQVEEFVKVKLPEILYQPAFEKLLKAQKKGHYTVILSTGPSFLVEAIAKFFKVNEWSASMYEFDGERRFVRIRSLMMGQDKAHHIDHLMKKLNVTREKVTAYSDSILDLPFLLAAGRAVVVNPDRKLFQMSKKYSWGVI